jgi:uncharacterized protein RhaS with RHS repeats
MGRYIESDPLGLAGGISTYSYVGSNPLSNMDPLGLESGAAMAALSRAEGFTPPGPELSPRISPEAKAYICKLLKQTNGQLQQAWVLADQQRLGNWNDPALRDAENWLYAAGWDVLQTTEPFIRAHQTMKLFPFISTSPYSYDALLAGLEGHLHQHESPATLLGSCDSCGSH